MLLLLFNDQWNISFSAEYSLTVYFRFTEVRIENCEKSLMLACQRYISITICVHQGFVQRISFTVNLECICHPSHYIYCTLLYLIYDNVMKNRKVPQLYICLKTEEHYSKSYYMHIFLFISAGNFHLQKSSHSKLEILIILNKCSHDIIHLST